MDCGPNTVRARDLTRRNSGVNVSSPSRSAVRTVGDTRVSLTVLGVMLALLVSSSGVAAAATNTANAAKPVLTFGINTGFVSTNPALDTDGPETTIRDLEYAFLFHLNPNGTAAPELATSWHYVGTGNTSFEFTLRQDARFSDGEQVNAQAVKEWLTYLGKADGPYAGWISIRSVQTVGDWTDIVHLAAPNPSLPFLLSDQVPIGAIVAPKAIANPALLANGSYGAGPYVEVASQSVENDHYTLVPNQYYYDPSAIHFSQIVAKIITQPSTMLEAIESGEVQLAVGDPTTVSAAANAGLSVKLAPFGNVGIQIIDRDGVLDKPLASPLVREALNYAINRKLITQALLGKYGEPSSEMLTLDGWVPSLASYYPYDPAKAKQLLAAAGYPRGFTFNVVSAGNKGNEGTPIAEAVAQNLSAVGVTMKITSAPTDAEWHTDITSKTYASWENNWETLPTIEAYAAFLTDPSNLNVFNVPDDPVLKELAGKAVTSSDADAIYQQMSRRITTQGIFIIVATYDNIWYATKNLQGNLPVSLADSWPILTGLTLKG
jgi:peptide/nickel transport system substrate-binding protein